MTQPSPFPLMGRSATLTVGPVQVSNIGGTIGLDFWFDVKRTLRKEPNTADIRIYNLSDASRKAIAAASQVVTSKGAAQSAQSATVAQLASGTVVTPVSIVAGYVGNTSTIFAGEMRSAQTTTDGPDTVTELTTGDGDVAGIIARANASFGAGANAYVVAKALLTAMGVGPGNIESFASVLRASPLYAGGTVLKGNASEALRNLAASCALEVSLQSGVAQFLTLGQPLSDQAYVLNSDTGLIGSPTVDTKGTLSFECLMLPGMRPGISVQLDALYVQGAYRVVSCQYTGDTSGNDWRIDVEARRPGTGLG